jgi:hypothetical protein
MRAYNNTPSTISLGASASKPLLITLRFFT